MLLETAENTSKAPNLTSDQRRQRCLDAAAKAKSLLLSAPQKVDTERLKYLVEIYQEYDSAPVIIKRARLFERLLHNKTLFLDDNPIVGTVTAYPAGVYMFPEWDSEWVLKEMRQAMMSHLGEINVTDEEKKIMLEAGKFFKKRSVAFQAREISKDLDEFDPDLYIRAGVFTDGTLYTNGAGNLDYDTFVRKGLRAIITETEARLRLLPVTVQSSAQIDFYRAALISMEAVVHLANRYADLAEETAAGETDQLRRAELLEIAEVCRRVPEYPPRTFREALQSWWLLHLAMQIEQSGCGSSPGRLGQYLDAYYQDDKRENGLSREDAIAWLKCLFVKILAYGYYQGLAYARLVSGHTGHTISLGGVKADGSDATTELDHLLLETQIDMRNIQPTLTVLYHDGLKEDFLLKAMELERTGLGQPQWLNNDIVVQRLLARYGRCGATLEDARNCVNMSCVATGIAGKTSFIRDIPSFNLAKMFELVMNRGADPMTGKQIGPDTGDPVSFASFEEFFEAFAIQVEHMFTLLRRYGCISKKVTGDTVPTSFRSCMYGGCLEHGKHEFDGGAYFCLDYSISTAGIDVANSLAAVKHLVYDTARVSMRELKEALAADFEGFAEIQQHCVDAPKHGNADPATDALVQRVYACALDKYLQAGGSYFGDNTANMEAYSLSIHNYYGMLTGALPTGRRKGTPLTDGSVSAAPGTDKNGPLALISSAATALDTVKYGSNHFNMKFHPKTVAGIEGARKLIALIKTYMDMGGSHIQFNIVTADTLRAAQANPAEHKGLAVRVAGFSAYYTRLHKGVQDEILARTEHAL